MKIKTNGAKWFIDGSGTWLSLRVNPQDARICSESIEDGKEYTADIKRNYAKRSINANDLLWELCTQLSKELSNDKLIVSKEEIYRKHIKSAGKCDFLAVTEKAVDDLMRGWSERGIGWFAEKVDDCKIPGCVKVCVYYGSSTYDTAEMSRLLDSVIQDCKAVGIEMLSPAEISLIKENWK